MSLFQRSSAFIRNNSIRTHFLLFIFCFSIFLAAPNTQVTDSHYALLLSQSILKHGSFDLSRYNTNVIGSHIHQLQKLDNKVYYLYPPGSSLLAMPFVIIFNAAGYKPYTKGLQYDPIHERRMQRVIAAFLISVVACIFLSIAKLFLPVEWSFFLVFAHIFGTSLFSTASLGMWSHTWSVFLFSILFYIIISNILIKNNPNGILLGTLLSWSFFCRPTNSFSIILFAIIIIYYFNKKTSIMLIMTGLSWLIAFVVHSYILYHTPLPGYFMHTAPAKSYLDGFLGLTVSPARGFFIYSTFSICIFYLLFKFLTKYLSNLSQYFVYYCLSCIYSHIQHSLAGGPDTATDLVL